jgi:hypothetical protein
MALEQLPFVMLILRHVTLQATMVRFSLFGKFLYLLHARLM